MKPIKIMNKLNESFWNPGKYFQLLQDMEDIDTEKWNKSNQEERDAMVRPFLQAFWDKYKDEMSDDDIEALFDDMEDSNYHTEGRVLEKIINGEENINESVGSSLNISVSKVANFIKQSVEDLTTTDYTNSRFILDDTFAIYVGWSDGYGDEERDDAIQDKNNPSWAINAGVKVRNDADWADYDFLNFPYYDNGEVFDSAVTISPNEDYNSTAEYLISQYEEIKKEYSSGELKID